MKQSRRAQRMERHYGRSKRRVALNLVSLMDIFTILVFFLLVNASEVEVLPTTKGVELPESVAETTPRESIIVSVTEKEILLQGSPVASVDGFMKANAAEIRKLQQALRAEFKVDEGKQKTQDPLGFEVTIMGDKATPFKVLKRVMQVCTSAGYSKISLSVIQKASQG